VDNVWQSLDNV